jgi:hemerythrin-like domain-containing protein
MFALRQSMAPAICDAEAMKRTALEIIHEEHSALSAMLRSMSMLVSQAHRENRPPDFEVLRAMMFYVDEFPERLHHPKESALLFPLLLQRSPELSEVLDRLDLDHASGERAIRDLEHALVAYEMMGEPRRETFEQHLGHYTRFYLEHMALEESVVLPKAQAVLDAADWRVLDDAFESNRDPMGGHQPDPEYRELFRRILMAAPAPVGLGSPRASGSGFALRAGRG